MKHLAIRPLRDVMTKCMAAKNQAVTFASVIIVVKNDRGIAATLDALATQQVRIPHEVIVIDASEPSVLADIRVNHPNVIWDQYPVSRLRTTPQQRNRGVALAKGDVIVFIDANCVPAQGWLQALIASLEQGESIVCGPVHDLNANNLVHYAPELDEGRYIDVCTTINVGMRRRVFDCVGNFDATFSFGQDIDFFWRATDAGFRIYYEPQANIAHDWGQRSEQLRRAYDYGKARAHLFKKHWRTRRRQLVSEPHVWMYPLFILGLPVTYFVPIYPLLLLVPLFKNRDHNPFGLTLHHLVFGWGVIIGTITIWPQGEAQGKTSRLAAA